MYQYRVPLTTFTTEQIIRYRVPLITPITECISPIQGPSHHIHHCTDQQPLVRCRTHLAGPMTEQVSELQPETGSLSLHLSLSGSATILEGKTPHNQRIINKKSATISRTLNNTVITRNWHKSAKLTQTSEERFFFAKKEKYHRDNNINIIMLTKKSKHFNLFVFQLSENENRIQKIRKSEN